MHVGCCENCRFIDLVEDHPDGCPRCGGKLVSLCIDSVHWNKLNAAGRRLLVMQVLTEPQLRPMPVPEFELDPEQKKTVIDDLVKKADDRAVQVRHAESAILEARMVEKGVRKDQMKLARSVIDEKKSKQKYAFICSRCYYSTESVRRSEQICCTGCGAKMLDTGYKAEDWALLSAEEKEKIISDTQFGYIVKSIRNESS